MKLESYEISQALAAGDTEEAIKLLADYFRLPRPHDVPFTKLLSNFEVRLLFWAGDHFYEWSSESGFDRGTHPMSGRLPHTPSDGIESIILWNKL